MNKRLLFILGLVIVLIAVCSGISSYLNSFQEVTLEAPENSKISLYKGDVSEEGVDYDKNSVVVSTEGSVTKKIKKGGYVYLVEPSNSDYKQITRSVEVNDMPVKITARLTYTDSKLDTLSQETFSSVAALMKSEYPQTMQTYTLSTVKAFDDGQWIGAVLSPSDPAQDTYLAVFNKTSTGTLELITDPPSIIVSSAVYPQIPREVVGAVNRLSGIGSD